MKKWLICGSREAPASLSRYVCDVLDRIVIIEGRPAGICHGAASGYDSLSNIWANERNVPCTKFPANWKKFGKSAGPKRNAQMLSEFKPDVVIAFPGSAGTSNMIQQAKKAGVKVIKVPDPKTLGYDKERSSRLAK
jgi:hypothetical protein